MADTETLDTVGKTWDGLSTGRKIAVGAVLLGVLVGVGGGAFRWGIEVGKGQAAGQYHQKQIDELKDRLTEIPTGYELRLGQSDNQTKNDGSSD